MNIGPASLVDASGIINSVINENGLSGISGLEGAVGALESLGNGELTKAADDFEALFMTLILKEMRESLKSGENGEGGLFGGDKSGSYGGIFDQFMGQHLAQANSLGLAQMVSKYVDNQTAADLGDNQNRDGIEATAQVDLSR